MTASPDGISGVAAYIPADPGARRDDGPGRRVTHLVLHITSGAARAQPVAEMFATPKARRSPPVSTSAHFIIGQDGTVLQSVRLDQVAYHAHFASGYSIGIEHCAREPRALGPTDPGLPLSEPQIEASVALVRELAGRYGIPLDRGHILGHSEADPSTNHTGCPGAVAGGFPWERWCPPSV